MNELENMAISAALPLEDAHRATSFTALITRPASGTRRAPVYDPSLL